jgi:hypothetical protein
MAVGNAVPKLGHNSCISIMEETAFNTFVTATANFLEFNSESFGQERENIKMESVNCSRAFTKRIVGNETISGSLEFDFDPGATAIAYIIKQAFGGTVTSVPNTSASADEYTHTFALGDMENNKATATASDHKSLSVSIMRGGTDTVWCYSGCRVNALTIKGEVGAPVVCTAEFMGAGASLTSTFPAASYSDIIPLYFKDITFKTGVTISAVSTTEWITNFEFTLNNNLDGDQRALGTRNIVQLPPSKRDVMLKLGMRFDTTTTYDRFIQNTQTAIQLILSSEQTIGAGTANSVYSMYINIPAGYFNSTQPQVGGNDVLVQEVEIDCMKKADPGYEVQIQLYNGTANYA